MVTIVGNILLHNWNQTLLHWPACKAFSVSLLELPQQNSRQNGLNNRSLFSHSCGGWKFKIKVLPELGGQSLWLLTASSQGCPSAHVHPGVCVS